MTSLLNGSLVPRAVLGVEDSKIQLRKGAYWPVVSIGAKAKMKAAINKSGSRLRLQRDTARFVYDNELPYLPGNDGELYQLRR